MPDRQASVVLEGQTVTLRIKRLSVRQFNEVAAYAGQRITADPIEQRAQFVDRFVEAEPGEFVVDGTSHTTGLTQWFPARRDVIDELFFALLAQQHLTPEEKQHLEIAVRFTHWLEKSRQEASASSWVKTGMDCSACRKAGLAERRGCDGTEKSSVVWHDKKLVLRTCPVRSLTPKNEEIIRVFFLTHEFDGMQWSQKFHFDPGGVGDQDAWLSDALASMRSVYASILRKEVVQEVIADE